MQTERDRRKAGEVMLDGVDVLDGADSQLPADFGDTEFEDSGMDAHNDINPLHVPIMQLRRELFEIRDLLAVPV